MNRSLLRVRRVLTVAIGALVLAGLAPGPVSARPPQHAPRVDLWLTILHNNDGESQLVDAGAGLEDFGGVARFASVVDRLRAEARVEPAYFRRPLLWRLRAPRASIMLSSGDNFLAGPEFNASLQPGAPFYDAIALERIGYDAIALGNHDFDFGPDVLAEFIGGFEDPTPYLGANLDFSAEPALQGLVDAGRVAGSTVVRRKGRRIGIVGATTEQLPFISSPRNVQVGDVAAAVQREVDHLLRRGITRIILISHLQSIDEDLALIPMLRGIDVAIAGGGDELLANDDDLLIPGDVADPALPYPIVARDSRGRAVPVVTTPGEYRYVGRLIVGFDRLGRVLLVDSRSGPVRVAGGDQPDAVSPDPELQARVVEPVQAFVDNLDATVIATSEVALDGLRANVRTVETNQGNLIADALLAQARQLAPAFGLPEPDIALQNGGGIRNNTVIPAGAFTELDTFDMLPFSNFLTVVPSVPREQLKTILENAVSAVEFSGVASPRSPGCE